MWIDGLMKNKIIETHLKVARIYGQLSTATRLKVGCIIVKDDRIISIGYNGMPSGASNVCEEDGETKPEHAEANSILKLAKSNESGLDSSMFTTYAPCIHCAKLILQSGIKELYYEEEYKNEEGIELLKKYSHVKIYQYETEKEFSQYIEDGMLPFSC